MQQLECGPIKGRAQHSLGLRGLAWTVNGSRAGRIANVAVTPGNATGAFKWGGVGPVPQQGVSCRCDSQAHGRAGQFWQVNSKLGFFWEAGSQAASGLADWTAGAGDHPPATTDHAESLFCLTQPPSFLDSQTTWKV
jgi:hypothetical protein